MRINTLLAAGAIAITSAAVQAAPMVSVAGVHWDAGSNFDFTSTSDLIEDQLDLPNGQNELHGFGLINKINQTSQSVFCPSGCELTYQFGGYTVATTTPDGNGGAAIDFTGGWINFYVDSSTAYNAEDESSATNGVLWLSLAAHEVAGITLEAALTSFGAGVDSGTGTGLLDVVGGLAAANFDTNSQTDGSDFVFSSSYQPIPFGHVTADGYELFGTADLRGESIAVSAPTTTLLFGLGLLGMAATRKRT